MLKPVVSIMLLTLLALASPALAEGPTAENPRDWLTLAEASGFKETSNYALTLGYIRRLAELWPGIDLKTYGESAQGRAMPVVVVSSDGAFTPETAAKTGKAIVMIQNGIHAGEIDGKDASLMILRDLALGQHRDLLDGVILVIVPIYNVDGHERISRFHRPNQNGPVDGMGFRTTADGHDLNRDHLKLVTPEAQAVIDLFRRWRPHLHVDNHVTDGSRHDWVLTYSWTEAPQAPPSVGAWLDAHMPAVIAATEEAGHKVGPYVSLIDRSDPSKGFNSYVGEPRYATGYYPLRNVPSILVENHSYKTFEQRVRANRDFMLALLGEIAQDPAALTGAVAEAANRTVALGRPDAAPSDIVLRYEVAEDGERVRWPAYRWYTAWSDILDVPLLRYRDGAINEVEVPWIHRPEPKLAIARPRGYLILPGWPTVEHALSRHGIVAHRLPKAVDLEVEVARVSNVKRDPRSNPSYQGLTRISVDVERTLETRNVPAGSLWIPADQRDFELAVQLLEPEAPDSLVSWGLLSQVAELKEYIDFRRLEEVVKDLLRDPEIAASWKQALEDPGLAEDPGARYEWWYRRTPYWDSTVGLLPVLRVLSPPAFHVGAAID